MARKAKTAQTTAPESTPAPVQATAAHPIASIECIPVAQIDESPTNPRRTFTGIEDLAEDLKRRGMLQPVLVRPQADPRGPRFELVFGARRFRAAKLAVLVLVPAMVREMSDKEVLETQIVENAKRADVHPLEEADGYRRLHEDHGYSVDDLASKLGKSKAAAAE